MNSRERVIAALNHKIPDRIPFDLGSTCLTSINKFAYINLRKYLNLNINKLEIYDYMQQLPVVEEDLLELLDVDMRGFRLNLPSNWKV